MSAVTKQVQELDHVIIRFAGDSGRGSVPAEEEVLTVVAAAWGWRVAARRRGAWFLPAEPVHRDGPGRAAGRAQRARAR